MTFMWRNRAGPGAEDADQADPAAEAAAIGRLRRVVNRVEQVEPPAAPTEAAPSRFAATDLMANAFAVLGVDLDASAEAISDAVDTLSFEPGHDPEALNAARARLMSARDRLAEELGWLPEPSPALRAQLRPALVAGDVVAVTAVRDATIGLARLNLSLALAICLPGEIDRATRVLVDGQAWDTNVTLGLLGEARARAGFRAIDDDIFDRAIQARAAAMAQALAPLFAASTTARTALTKAMQAAPPSLAGFGAMFLDEVMRCYAAAIDPALEQAQARITAATEALIARPGDHAQATALTTSFDLWSSLRRPIQVHEAARGLDDPASARIFEAVRGLTVTLSNDHNDYDIALRLARALISSFALVPFHRAALERELPTLIGNVSGKRLRQLCAKALAHYAVFAREVQAGGLGGTAGLAGQLASIFADSLESSPDNRGAFFMIVRGLAVDLFNDLRDRRTAVAVAQWLLSQGPPAKERAQLESDLAQLGGQPMGSAAPIEPVPNPGGFGRANRCGATAPAAPPPWVRPPDAVPEWQPTRSRRKRGSSGLATIVIAFFVLMSFCSRPHTPRHTSWVDQHDNSSHYIPRAPTPYRGVDDAVAERIRADNERLRSGQGEEPVIVPGQPMSDAQPLPPTPLDPNQSTLPPDPNRVPGATR
ncbi:hypothetical protein GCM10009087_21310 [Sphingomonas oligophenolica]|uniref:DUF1631 family protein n=1 Tax=Sphingomonas oligophenolica TaxID=301154 RepID=A0ABU9Y3Q6_9SPHN